MSIPRFSILRFMAGCAIAALTAFAQPPGRGGSGVAFGHIHLNSSDPDKAIAFWSDVIGASTYSKGSFRGVGISGAVIFIGKGEVAGPSAGSAIDRIGFNVPDVQVFVDKLAKTEYKCFKPVPDGDQLIIDGPDGVRIELTEDNAMYNPLEYSHIVLKSAHPDEMQAWYAKVFGARAIPDEKPGRKALLSRMPGGMMEFAQGDSVKPSAGRAIDHIAFEVKGLEAFCAKLAGDGVKLDSPYKAMPEMKMAAAYLTDPWGTKVELTEGLGH